VVVRVVKRQDKSRRRIKAHPIYNTKKTALKYRWEYLGDDFNTDRSILDIDIESLHKEVDPRKLIIDNFFTFQQKQQKKESVKKEQESLDTPFSPMTYENWGTKSVKEFFSEDPSVFEILKTELPGVMNKTIEEIQQQAMDDFVDEFKILSQNDQLDSNVYQLVETKIETTLAKLQGEVETQEA